MNSATTQRIHIAVALAALSHKPTAQSFSSYLLDLKAQFPVSHYEEVCHSRPLDENNPWRKRALALEEENEALKLHAQKQELEVLALKAAPVDDSNAGQESSLAPKKKKAAQAASKAAPDRVDLRILIKDLRSGPRLPVLKDSLDVLTSFRTIQISGTGPAESETDHETILIPNIKRSLAALGKLITAVLARDASVVAASSRVDVVSCLCNLLLGLLNSMLPLAPRHALLPHILGDLTICIVRPIIRGFHTLSVHELTSAVKEKTRKKTELDVRPDLLNILRKLIEYLRTLKARTRDLREFMVFEAAKEVEALWSSEGSKQPTDEPSCEERIEKLARKDSLWYQCSVLHAALDRFPPLKASEVGDESLLSSEAIRVLADLARHFERGTPVDEVAKGMVLGVVEKAWLSGLYEPPPGTPEREDL